MLTDQVEWHTFFPDKLGPDARVLDLGANHGGFALEIIRKYGCRCWAVEPTPDLFSQLPEHARLTKLNLAICATSGWVPFAVRENSESSGIVTAPRATEKVIRVPGRNLEELCQELGLRSLDLLKMDIEGQEVAVFDSCSDAFWKSVAQITMEFHDFCGLTAPQDIRRIFVRMRNLGFYPICMSGRSHLDTLFIQCDRLGVSRAEALWVKYGLRNLRGAARVLRRLGGVTP